MKSGVLRFKFVVDESENKEKNIELANSRSKVVAEFLEGLSTNKKLVIDKVNWFDYICELNGNASCNRDVEQTYQLLEAAMIVDRDSKGNILEIPARFNRRIDLSIELPSGCDSDIEFANR